MESPYKPTGGLRVLGGNLSPDFSAVLKLAGVEAGLEDNVFRGNARVFEGERGLLDALEHDPGSFSNHDMVIVRYEGPSGAPGMPEMLDSTSRITTLCRERGIAVGLMTDARFSGGSVGLVIGHVGPEAAIGGPIAFVEDGDDIVVDLDHRELNCPALDDPATLAARQAAWQAVVDANLTGAFLCTQEAFRAMKDQDPRGGRIINNGSISADRPRPHSAPYTATKHAITGLTKSTSLDGRSHDIVCGQIDIGNAETPMTQRMKEGVPQPDGSIAVEPTMNVDNVGRAVVYMDSLPLKENVLFMTVMANEMPFVGRG